LNSTRTAINQKGNQAMGYPTKVQLISRKKGADQYYINFPTAVAEAMEFQKGETIEWIIEDKANIIAHRPVVPASPVRIGEKKLHATARGVGKALGRLRPAGIEHRFLPAAAARTPPGPSGLPGPPHPLWIDHDLWEAVRRLDEQLLSVFARQMDLFAVLPGEIQTCSDANLGL